MNNINDFIVVTKIIYREDQYRNAYNLDFSHPKYELKQMIRISSIDYLHSFDDGKNTIYRLVFNDSSNLSDMFIKESPDELLSMINFKCENNL